MGKPDAVDGKATRDTLLVFVLPLVLLTALLSGCEDSVFARHPTAPSPCPPDTVRIVVHDTLRVRCPDDK